MLVLTRKRGERILIGDGIEVVVLKSQGDRVQLGFIAPSDVPIQREEIVDKRRPAAPARVFQSRRAIA